MNIYYFANQFYNIFFISPSDKPDACMIVSIGTPRERRLDAIFTLASFLNTSTGEPCPLSLISVGSVEVVVQWVGIFEYLAFAEESFHLDFGCLDRV